MGGNPVAGDVINPTMPTERTWRQRACAEEPLMTAPTGVSTLSELAPKITHDVAVAISGRILPIRTRSPYW